MTRTAEVSEDDPSRLVSVVGGGAFYHVCVADVKPFIELLKSIDTGSIVIMASYDEPSTK